MKNGVIPRTNCDNVLICIEHGTNEVVTAFPSGTNPLEIFGKQGEAR
jgi:hypothetical protein